MHFTARLESTDLSIWLRESPSLLAFPFVLIVHARGMGFLAGSNAALDLRIIGFAPRVSLSAMGKFFPVMWFGFIINAISGVLLLIAYPTKALTNPVFYLKIGLLVRHLHKIPDTTGHYLAREQKRFPGEHFAFPHQQKRSPYREMAVASTLDNGGKPRCQECEGYLRSVSR